MKKILYIILLLSISVNIYFVSNRVESKKNMELNGGGINYMDDVSKIDIQRENDTVEKDWGKNKVIVMLKPECSSCYDILPMIEELSNIVKNSNREVVLIWNNRYPKNKSKISNKKLQQFVCKNVNFESPTFLITDDNSKVTFKTTDSRKWIMKIFDKDRERFKKNSLDVLREKFSITEGGDFTIYFYMEGCSDCSEASNLLDKKKELLLGKNFKILYRYNDNLDEDELYHMGKHYDIFDLYSILYNIDWYPSFLKVKDNDIKVYGKGNINNVINEVTK